MPRVRGGALAVVTSSPAIGAAASANGLTVIMLGGVVVADVGAITSLFTEPLADPAVLAAFRAAEVEVLNG